MSHQQNTNAAREAGQEYRIEKNEDGYWVCEGTHMMGCYRTKEQAEAELELLEKASVTYPPTNAGAAGTAQIEVKCEVRNPDVDLRRCIDRINQANPSTRDHAKRVILGEGFKCHVGGRHVAILHGKERLAIVTHPTALDFN